MLPEILLCSDCFHDEGLKLNSIEIGITDERTCPNCNSTLGSKLDVKLIDKLIHQFFVLGTFNKTEFGGAPIIQINNHHHCKTKIEVPTWLNNDLQILEKFSTMGLFYYGPRLYMIGEIEPLNGLLDSDKRNDVINTILDKFPTKIINSEYKFYRIRINPKYPESIIEYCSPPDNYLGKGRLDSFGFPILYGSEILDLCLHECRVSSKDNIYMATLRTNSELKLLDLSELIDENVSEFESLDLTIHYLFLAEEHSYEICREICKAAKESGYDGIIYPSYFSYIAAGNIPFESSYGISIRKIPSLKEYSKSQILPNIALFGRPVLDNKIAVESINRVILTKVTYNAIFGPVKI